jgi:hypothetical protein
MAALLAVHGLMTPGVLVGMNGLISVTGAATLSVGAAVLSLSVLSPFAASTAIPRVLGVQAALAVAIITLSLIGALFPNVVPAVPEPRSTPALLLLAVTLVLYGWLAVRAANTFLLTRRLADLAVVLGLMLLAAATYGALVLTFMDLGWWFGHIFEVLGIAVVGASLAYDPPPRPALAPAPRRPARERDRRVRGAFLGARVRALMVTLAPRTPRRKSTPAASPRSPSRSASR